MKKSVAILAVLLLLGASLFATGSQETGTVKKTVINFPTAATTGAIYPLGSAIANLWNNTFHGRAWMPGTDGTCEL